MAGQVNAAVAETQRLEGVIRSYAERERQAIGSARREAQQSLQRCEEEKNSRQNRLNHARENTAQAEQALAACRENCGGLAAAVAHCRQEQNKAQQSFDRAAKAARMMGEANRDLLAGLSSAEQTLEHIAPAGTNALRQLGQTLHHTITVAEMAATIAVSSIGAGRGIVQQMQATGHLTDPRSSSQRVADERRDKQQDLYQLASDADDAEKFARGERD